MHAPGQSHEDASNATWNFIMDNINSGLMHNFGAALHTIQDYASPTHTNALFEPYQWSGMGRSFLPWDESFLIPHFMGETVTIVSWDRLMMSVELTLAAYIEFDPVAAAKQGLTYDTLIGQSQKKTVAYIDSYLVGIYLSSLPGGYASNIIDIQNALARDREAIILLNGRAGCLCKLIH